MYLPQGAIPGSIYWCSDKNPQGTCRPLVNVCKPMDVATAEIFKELQRQANRCAAALGVSPIAVDARPGKDTISLINKALGTTYTHCDYVAAVADMVTRQLKERADALNAPKTAPAKQVAAGASTGVDKGIFEPAQPPGMLTRAGLVEFFTSPVGLALVAGGIAYFVYTDPKMKKKIKQWF